MIVIVCFVFVVLFVCDVVMKVDVCNILCMYYCMF